ncbi:MAG: hypothetical protein JO112_15295, partial [Planctomycetes bacterium]|nr:hypothetical protein [Planctomycetota bacterium]
FMVRPNRGAKSFEPVSTNGSQRGGRPLFAFLPHRVQDVQILEGGDLQPLVTDNFVLVPLPRKCDPDRVYKVVFKATRVR